MSNTAAPSPDLGDSQPRTISITRLHPTRLQHSPSLPNIRFPQHSGPIPFDAKSIMQRPSAPSSPKLETSLLPQTDASENSELRPRHVKYASIDPTNRQRSGTSSKTHARRRTERDQPNALLTPPLTPSHSIRTTASFPASADSGTEGQEAQTDRDQEGTDEPQAAEEVIDVDPNATRILLLGNVNRRISVEALETAIYGALAGAAVLLAGSTKNESDAPANSLRPDPAIKGVNQRYLQAEGIVPVVFFDVRAAKIVQKLVRDPESDVGLREKLGASGGEGQGLSAQLISAEELSKKLGNSAFLESIDGSFYLAVQNVGQNATADSSSTVDEVVQEMKVLSVSGSKAEADMDTIRGSINGAMLYHFLKSFGSIRFFIFSRLEVNEDGSTSLIYHVEYNDLRDADSAYSELHGSIMCGMKLGVFGKAEVTGRPSLPDAGDIIPFPNVSTAGESFAGLAIGSAGSQSQIRTRFRYPGQEDNGSHDSRPQHATLQVTTIPNGAPSPTVFYTSSFGGSPGNVAQGPNEQSNHVHAPRAPDMNIQAPPHSQSAYHEPGWDNGTIYRSDTVSPCYTPEGVCRYCPSRGALHSVPFNSTYGPYSLSPPPTPTVYYPQGMQMMSNPNGPHNVLGYDYTDPQQMQPMPMPQSGPWGYDPTIAALAPGPNTMLPVPMPMNSAAPPPFFIREDAPLVTSGRTYHPGYLRTPEPPHPVHHLPHAAEPTSTPEMADRMGRAAGRLARPRSSSPSSHRSSHSHLQHEHAGAGASPNNSGQNDRNQLNLAKIEEGVDTRTTVMIKNIPNKMSDEDLTTYIGRVCPRRIDFLYLRMDFQNGCNVGYAFVNFIHVQDLLRFAKARLGEKWNMFSSEKVLQMSYANYQGKEALVEKFKNSAIMDERESWRPRIFHSGGTSIGLPEPFPAPTHIRRKERSSYNRGALFVPGVNGHGGLHHSQSLLHNTGRRYQEDYRSQRTRSGLDNRRSNSPRQGDERDSRHNDKSTYRSSTYRATAR